MQNSSNDLWLRCAYEVYGHACNDLAINSEHAKNTTISLSEYRHEQLTLGFRPLCEASPGESGIFIRVICPETFEQWTRRSPLALFPESPEHYRAIGKLLNTAAVLDARYDSSFSEIETHNPDTALAVLAASGLLRSEMRNTTAFDLCLLLWQQAERLGL